MLVIHDWWHLALLHLDQDSTNEDLRLYDEHIRTSKFGMPFERGDHDKAASRLRNLRPKVHRFGSSPVSLAWAANANEPSGRAGLHAFTFQ